MNRFTFQPSGPVPHDFLASDAEKINGFERVFTLISRHAAAQGEALVSEAILRLEASALPDEELARRGVIQITRDDHISTFMRDGKPIVQWRLGEDWKMKWEWLPDAPPLITTP